MNKTETIQAYQNLIAKNMRKIREVKRQKEILVEYLEKVDSTEPSYVYEQIVKVVVRVLKRLNKIYDMLEKDIIEYGKIIESLGGKISQ